MVTFNVIILKFATKGEKTGWTYIEVPANIAQQLNLKQKKSFRVKGKLDDYSFNSVALLPMGEGNFIMPLNTSIRKGIHKKHGAMVQVVLELDKTPIQLNQELVTCLKDEPEAFEYFSQLAKSHQHYFSKWIESAKTESTKTKRIIQTVTAMLKRQIYSEMIRSIRNS